jgi:NAD-dependent dihydropyrimidine dehydrogenase PreA subunit
MTRKIWYSAADIERHFRNAGGYTEEAMRVLCELNNCTRDDIYAACPRDDWTLIKSSDFDTTEADRLYHLGISEREMARILGSTRWFVKMWREEMGYPITENRGGWHSGGKYKTSNMDLDATISH